MQMNKVQKQFSMEPVGSEEEEEDEDEPLIAPLQHPRAPMAHPSASVVFVPRSSGAAAGVLDLSAARNLARSVAAHDPAAPPCSAASTSLLLPFSFWPTHDLEPPGRVVEALLQRHVNGLPLWERAELPRETAELAPHFRQVLCPPLRVTDAARAYLFDGARLWADMQRGDCAGKRALWTDVHLVVFAHCAVLWVSLDWAVERQGDLTLADLRTWIYVAKFRTIKAGVARGWTFALHADASVSELGPALYAALCKGTSVALATVANWLVKLPHESSRALPRRVSRFDYCAHHSFAAVARLPRPRKALDELLLHLQRACKAGDSTRPPLESPILSGQVVALRAKVLVTMAREGILALAWGKSKRHAGFQAEFMGLYRTLSVHCMAERFTIDKLAYLNALQAQHLPTFDDVATTTPEAARARQLQRDRARVQLLSLATLLVRYRSGMASEDCGGRPEVSEFFQVLRELHRIAELKRELGEEMQDMLTVVDRDWMDSRQRDKKADELWKLQRDALQKRVVTAKGSVHAVFDIASNSFAAIAFPIMLAINIFSMNLPSLPREVPWAWVIVGAATGAVLFFFVFLAIYLYHRSAIVAIRDEKRVLHREWQQYLEQQQRIEGNSAVDQPVVDEEDSVVAGEGGGGGEEDGTLADDDLVRTRRVATPDKQTTSPRAVAFTLPASDAVRASPSSPSSSSAQLYLSSDHVRDFSIDLPRDASPVAW